MSQNKSIAALDIVSELKDPRQHGKKKARQAMKSYILSVAEDVVTKLCTASNLI